MFQWLLFGIGASIASPIPEWVESAVHLFMPPTAPGAEILSADGLWNAIEEWDASEKGQEVPFLSDDETKNKYQVAAFLANCYQESLWAFNGIGTSRNKNDFDKNYGINEIVCDDHVGYCTENVSETDPAACPDTFIQDPSECESPWGGKYGLYWGRGSIQVTCRKGTGPPATPDFCATYNNVQIFYKDYIAEQGWPANVLQIEPYRVALDSTLAWGAGIIYWMNSGHCYSCHQWAQLRDFAGTIESINGGWGNGESPLTNNDADKWYKPQTRITAFLNVTALLGLDVEADNWNGLNLQAKCPCELYFGPGSPALCTNGGWTDELCFMNTTVLPAGFPFDLSPDADGGSTADADMGGNNTASASHRVWASLAMTGVPVCAALLV